MRKAPERDIQSRVLWSNVRKNFAVHWKIFSLSLQERANCVLELCSKKISGHEVFLFFFSRFFHNLDTFSSNLDFNRSRYPLLSLRTISVICIFLVLGCRLFFHLNSPFRLSRVLFPSTEYFTFYKSSKNNFSPPR